MVLLLLAAGAGVWWLATDRGDGPEGGPPAQEDGAVESPPSLATGVGAGPGSRARQSERASVPSQAAENAAAAGGDSIIRVRLPAGVRPEEAVVRLTFTPLFHSHEFNPPPVSRVAEIETRDGALLVRAEPPEGGPWESVRILVALPGHPTASSTFWFVGGTTELRTVTIPVGVPFGGRIADRTGRPVPGLRLVLASAPTESYAVFAEDLDLDRWLAAGRSGQHVTTVTREDGTFTARVAPELTYAVLADDERWIVAGPPGRVGVGRTGATGVTLTVIPAVTLRGTVTDAGTDWLLSRFNMSVEQRGGAPEQTLRFGCQAPTSPYRITWARLDAVATETCDVAFEAKDYLPEKATVRWLPGESVVRHDVRLRTVASAGGRVPATIEVVDASGRPVDAPFFVEVRTPTESPTVLTSASMTRSAAGRYTSELPPGEADVRVVLPQHFYWVCSWHGRVLVESGRDLVVKAQVPSSAPLALLWPAASAAERFPGLFFRKAGDASWSSEGLAPTGEDAGTKFAQWPAGAWEFARADFGSEPAPGSAAGTVTITAGQPATLELKRPAR